LSAPEPANLEEAALRLMPRIVYERYVGPYNEKQWGVAATALEASLCQRFDVREDDDPSFSPRATFQGLPVNGYLALVENMLDGITVVRDRPVRRGEVRARRRLFCTGPIDAWYNRVLGPLRYRCQRRATTTSTTPLPAPVVNNPGHEGGPHIRTIDWGWLSGDGARPRVGETLWTTEIPDDATHDDELEYPFPSVTMRERYERYVALARSLDGDSVVFCGRLGEYRYLDMDQAIARAMLIAGRELGREET